ncbi:MFS transporter [Sphaerisporangium album]|uniref:MFS transporter n=1 Tax=Sphaerisporangium album TaxID=509200 RepID=A0A367FJT9_9ACTN|nr:MFS transporter [Sphaerisporangium album]RCG30159.1 MFS transporter [Sphaerisporangium album]
MVRTPGREHVREAAGLRRLLWGRGVSALGDGLWFTIWVLYFTRVLHLPPATVGAAMAVAGGLGLAVAIPLGAMADRFDARTVLVCVTVIRGAAMACYALSGDPWAFVLVTAVFVAPSNGATAVRTALVAGLVPGTDARVRALARQRVAQHVGYALGAALGAVVLAADDASVYRLAVVANTVSFAVLAVLTATIPRTRASGQRRPGARLVLHDRPYLAVVGATSLLSLCWAMLSTGLPLWVANSTRLPLSLSGVVVVISSVGIAALQVFVTRFTRTVAGAARTVVWAGGFLAVSCVLLATTAGGSGAGAITVVTAAALFHVAGELGYVGGSWGLSVALMREDARGAYQGASEAATATVQMFAPAVFTLALTTFAAAGWLLVAVVFLACSLPVPALARRAARWR